MCTTCGCGNSARTTITDLTPGKLHPLSGHDRHGAFLRRPAPPPESEPAPAHANIHGTTVDLEQDILAKNNRLAEQNRAWFQAHHILALNLVSSPGAGKTTLLEHTLRDLAASLPISVVEGDQETLFDAERIRATGCPAVQINTGTGCHLEAGMLAEALRQLAPAPGSLVMVENVGNLVCPALFDLGERAKW